jgi:hypothetical protein
MSLGTVFRAFTKDMGKVAAKAKALPTPNMLRTMPTASRTELSPNLTQQFQDKVELGYNPDHLIIVKSKNQKEVILDEERIQLDAFRKALQAAERTAE